jgi:hypothetical protein
VEPDYAPQARRVEVGPTGAVADFALVQSSDGSGEARVDVALDRPASVAIALDADAVVTGQLVDPAGKPLAGQAVVVTEDHGDGSMRIQLDGPPPTTGPDGRFRIEHRAAPCVLVVLRQPSPFLRRGLALVAGQTLDLGTVTVDPPSGSGAPPH